MEPSFNEIQRVELIVNTQPLSSHAPLMSLYIYQGINVSDHATLTFMRERDSSFYLNHGDTVAIGLGGGNGKLPVVYEGVVTGFEETPQEYTVCLNSKGSCILREPLRLEEYKDKSSSEAIKELLSLLKLESGIDEKKTTEARKFAQLYCGGVSGREVITYLASMENQGIFVSGSSIDFVQLSANKSAVLNLTEGVDILDYRFKKQNGTVSGGLKIQGTELALPGRVVSVSADSLLLKGDYLIGTVVHEIKDGNWFTTIGLDAPPVVLPPALVFSGKVNAITNQGIDIEVNLPPDHANDKAPLTKKLTLPMSVNGITPVPMLNQLVELTGTVTGPLQIQAPLWSGFESFYADGIKLMGVENKQLVCYGSDGAKLTIEQTKDGLGLKVAKGTAANAKFTLSDEYGNSIVMDKDSVSIKSNGVVATKASGVKGQAAETAKELVNSIVVGNKGVVVESPNQITLQHHTGMVKVDYNMQVTALNIEQSALGSLSLKGQAAAELIAKGQTTVRGAIVMIN